MPSRSFVESESLLLVAAIGIAPTPEAWQTVDSLMDARP